MLGWVVRVELGGLRGKGSTVLTSVFLFKRPRLLGEAFKFRISPAVQPSDFPYTLKPSTPKQAHDSTAGCIRHRAKPHRQVDGEARRCLRACLVGRARACTNVQEREYFTIIYLALEFARANRDLKFTLRHLKLVRLKDTEICTEL